MFLILLIVLGVAAWAVTSFGLLPSPFSQTLLRIRDGSVRVEKGELKARAREHVADVVREAGLKSGFVAISRTRKVTFSSGFPESLRQTLRNILLN